MVLRTRMTTTITNNPIKQFAHDEEPQFAHDDEPQFAHDKEPPLGLLYRPQSGEVNVATSPIQDISFWNMISSYNPLSVSAMSDVNHRTNTIKNWLFHGDRYGKSFISEYMNVPATLDSHVHLLEDVVLLMYSMLRSRTTLDRYTAVIAFCKMRGSRPSFTTVLLYVMSDLFGSTLQQAYHQSHDDSRLVDEISARIYTPQSEEFDNIFAQARSYTSMFDKLQETVLYKKIYKFGLYILASGLLNNTNISFDSFNFTKFEAESFKRTHKPGISMMHCMIDTVLFVCDKGCQFFHNGDPEVFMSGGGSYDKWMSRAQRLIRESKFLTNPEPHQIDRFKFTSELKDTIERGKAVVKFTAGLERSEKLILQKVLNELQMIEAFEITKQDAQKPRKDPFAVLIHGPSSIAKSQLTQMLFYHYAKCFNLPAASEFMYTRCPTDEYWSGFTSAQWCIVMDDIAFLKPNGDLDPTLSELLQVKNSVPYTPPQASLEDKGRTPVKCELLLGTTNTKNLNLQDYFSCPFAIARRFNYIITATVKSDYAKHNVMVDSTKIPVTQEGEYMNIWNFDISIALPATDSHQDGQKAKYCSVQKFEDIHDLLSWFIVVAKEHEISQQKAKTANTTMIDVQICQKCYRAVKVCSCFQLQALEQSDSILQQVGVKLDSVFTNVPIIPIEDEPIEPEPECTVSFMKYWFLCRIIAQEELDYEWEAILFVHMFRFAALLVPFSIIVLIKFPLLTFFFCCIYGLIHFSKYVWIILSYYFQYKYGSMWKYVIAFALLKNESSAYIFVFKLTKRRVQRAFTPRNILKLIVFLTALKGCKEFFSFFSLRAHKKSVKSELKRYEQKDKDVKGESEFKLQADVKNVVGGSPPQPHSEEKPTFYYHDPYVFTDVDISNQSKNCQPGVLENRIRRNTARFHFRWKGNEGNINSTTAVNVKGHIWMFNTHVIRGYGCGTVDVIFDPVTQNVSRSISGIAISDVYSMPGTDLSFIELKAFPPGPSIYEYFPKKDRIPGNFNGEYHLIDNDGTRAVLPIVNIRKGTCPYFAKPSYLGNVSTPTRNGQCGSLCVMHAGSTRKILIGIHTTGNDRDGVSMTPVSQYLLDQVFTHFKPQISSGVVEIDAPGYPRELGAVHFKSPLRFIPVGTAHVLGSFKGFRPQHKSRVTNTYIRDYVVQDGYIDDHGPPDMSWRPWHLGLTDMTQPDYSVKSSDVDACSKAFLDDILAGMGDKIKELKPYDLNTALNGADGVAYVDRINIRTSAGNPFKKSKLNFVTLDERNKIEDLDDVIMNRIKRIEILYHSGVRAHPQFCEHLKDDPMPTKKRISGATRLFSGGEFAWSVVVRKYLLSHIRMIQNNPYLFEAMPGVVAQSEEWERLRAAIAKYGLARVIAGDYGKFDKKMIALFVQAAFDVLIGMAKAAGWAERDLQKLRCIAADTAYATIEFNGDLIEIQGNPSGHPLTVIINCIVNSLYMRYAFMKVTIHPLNQFKSMVSLVTYGDDNLMSVNELCPEFNHTSISQALACIGVKYTMADKEAESIPYIHLDDASFLKRKFVFDKDIGAYVGPLEHASIDKMLTSYVDNGQISAQAHSLCVIETALREYFFYGKEKFEERKLYFKGIVKQANLEVWVTDSTFPEYEQLVYDFWMRTGNEVMAEKFAPTIKP